MFSGVSKLIKRYRKKTLRDGGSLFQLDEAAQYLHTVLEFRTPLHSNCNHREIGRFWTIVTELETDIWTLAETLYICTCTYMCSLCIHTMFMYMHLCLCVSLCVYYASTPYFFMQSQCICACGYLYPLSESSQNHRLPQYKIYYGHQNIIHFM